MKKTVLWSCIVLSGFLFCLPSYSQGAFFEDFESGIGNWWVTNGVWEVGTPTVGPKSAYGGSNCAGTVLNGNYPLYTDSRIVSPSIRLPSVTGDDEIHLRFWHWFSNCTSTVDGCGVVQIQIYDENESLWPDTWTTISTNFNGTSSAWTKTDIDLTSYSGQKIKLAFYHTQNSSWPNTCNSTGWYIDDVEINALTWGDVNADGKIGLPEAIHALQVTAGIE